MTETTGTDLVVQGHVTDNRMRVYSLNRDDLAVGPGDREVLRRLAGRVAELAARPVEDKKRELWYRHNALEATGPVVYVEPEDGWREIFPEEIAGCQNIVARQWEVYLRKLIFPARKWVTILSSPPSSTSATSTPSCTGDCGKHRWRRNWRADSHRLEVPLKIL